MLKRLCQCQDYPDPSPRQLINLIAFWALVQLSLSGQEHLVHDITQPLRLPISVVSCSVESSSASTLSFAHFCGQLFCRVYAVPQPCPLPFSVVSCWQSLHSPNLVVCPFLWSAVGRVYAVPQLWQSRHLPISVVSRLAGVCSIHVILGRQCDIGKVI